jgi:uncharacterized protein (DUF2461 family)
LWRDWLLGDVSLFIEALHPPLRLAKKILGQVFNDLPQKSPVDYRKSQLFIDYISIE